MILAPLIEEVKQGHKAAQQLLFDKLRPECMILCMRYMKIKEDAEDCMLNGFHKFFVNIDKFIYRHDEGLYAWVIVIMRNECLKQLRSKSLFNIGIETEALDISNQENILDKISEQEIIRMVWKLPMGYRTVFNLMIDGYDHNEIAEMLNISRGTSKSQLSKARCQIQKMLLSHGTANVKQQ